MKLHIDDTRSIEELQKQFNDAFPYLKIEFFKKPHQVGETSPLKEMLPADTNLGKSRTIHTEGDFFFTKDTTVSKVEMGFQESFGISVQVFRKSGKVWLETSATDGWTLEEQNEQGAFMAQEIGE